MSKIGGAPIKIEEGIKVEISGSDVKISGKKGQSSLKIPADIEVKEDNGNIIVTRKNDLKQTKSNHGTIRSILAGMVKGVNEENKKELEMGGMGYRASME